MSIITLLSKFANVSVVSNSKNELNIHQQFYLTQENLQKIAITIHNNLSNENFLKYYNRRIYSIEIRLFIRRNFIHATNIEPTALLEVLLLVYEAIYNGNQESIQNLSNLLTTISSYSSHFDSLIEDLQDDNNIPYVYINYFFGTPTPTSAFLENGIQRDFNFSLRQSVRVVTLQFQRLLNAHSNAEDIENLNRHYDNENLIFNELNNFYLRNRRLRRNTRIIENRFNLHLRNLYYLDRHHRNVLRRGQGLQQRLFDLRRHIRSITV
jgi:hypothetical protein